MYRTKLKSVFFILVIFLLGIRADVQGAEKLPNIVIIYADDVGYGDLSSYNSQAAYTTPVLDKMAAEGMRFLDGHSASTVCSPSRYALLSGKQPYRGPGTKVFLGAGGPSGLKSNEKTLPQMLQSKGYRTGVFGKWHVGLTFYNSSGQALTAGSLADVMAIDYARSTPLIDGPNTRGFNKSFITAGCPLTDFLYAYIVDGMVPVQPTFLSNNSSYPNYDGRWARGFRQGLTASDYTFEGIDWVFLSQAINFMLDHVNNFPTSPFFMELATASCHAPVLPRPDMIGRTGSAGARGDYMFELDTIVGEVFKTLTTLGIDSNTIVLFSSDNGAETWHTVWMRDYYNHDPVRPWRGFKRDAWEGGHRVPVIVRWPGKIPAGKVTNQMFNQTDIFATLASIVGYALPDSEATDSWDMYPVLLGHQPETISVRNILLTQSNQNTFFELRQGKWKYIDGQGSGGNDYSDAMLVPYVIADPTAAPAQLYNLDTDPGETINLYYTESAKREELKNLLEQSKSSGRSAPTGRTPYVPNSATNILPKATITSPLNGGTFQTTSQITVSATASDTDGTVKNVEFYRDSTVYLGSNSTAPYGLNIGTLAAGTHTIHAVAVDNNDGRGNSPKISIVVNPVVLTNLALNKTSKQSSTASKAVPKRANDGNTSGNWADNSVSSTAKNAQAWWQVDLGSAKTINSVSVWNRTDCCGDRLLNFDVKISSNAVTWTTSQYLAGQCGRPSAFNFGSVTGRYVRVQLRGTNILNIAEVQVFGN